jgi:hypothetical protein
LILSGGRQIDFADSAWLTKREAGKLERA